MKSMTDGRRPTSRAARSVSRYARTIAGAVLVSAMVAVAGASASPSSSVAVAPTATDAATAADSAGTETVFLPPSESPEWAPSPWAPRAAGEAAGVALPAALEARSSRRGANGISAVASVETTDIPGDALAAYQRAAVVIDKAMPRCGLTWELVAAIGRVESNHGQFGGSSLNDEGVATPAIIGVALTGRDGTRRITDTDAGQLDGDRRLDRAVGPMQFLPSTWSVVGVDGDADGERNPQDIDDAALAAGVYLCGGSEKLTTTRGLREAVFTYNRSEQYVDTVLALMRSYADADSESTTSAVLSAVAVTSTSTTAVPTGAGSISGQVKPIVKDVVDKAGGTKHTSGTKSGKPGKKQTSGAKGDKPGTKGDKPGTKGDKPGTKGDKPPATKDPTTKPPVTKDPTTKPPATKDPTTKPPVTKPPVTKPPVIKDPTTEDPSTDEPAEEPSEEPAPEPAPEPANEPVVVPTEDPITCPSEEELAETDDEGNLIWTTETLPEGCEPLDPEPTP